MDNKLTEDQQKALDAGVVTLEDLEFLSKLELYQQQNGIEWYEHSPKQELFHRSNAPYRLLHGANRCGKTYSGGAEAVWYATGLHPYKKVRTPCEGWVCSPDYELQVDGAQKIVLGLLPKDMIKNIYYVKHDIVKQIELKNRSKISFKSYDSGPAKFQAAAKRWIWFDEEPPFEIWKESIARIGAGQPLDLWLTMTPIKENKDGKKMGMTWAYSELYRKRDGSRIFTVGVGIEDNPYLSKEQVEEQKRKYTGAEYDIRIKGEFKLLAGTLVFDTNTVEELSTGLPSPRRGYLSEATATEKLSFQEMPTGALRLWKDPVPGRQYAVGADVGLGTGGDPSAACVLDMQTCEQVAELHCNVPPDQWGAELLKLATHYNKAWLGIEANSFGIAAIDSVKKIYSKLYYRYKVDRRSDEKTKQLGWWTDTKTKPLMISDFGAALREGAVIINSAELVDELSTYIIDDNGSANATIGSHDDRVMASMIAFQVWKRFHLLGAATQLEGYKPSNTTTGY